MKEKPTLKGARLYALLLLIPMLLLGYISANAQDVATQVSLKDCINYGLANSALVQKSKLEVDKNREKVHEGVAAYLPQIKASGSLTDNLKLATSILPGEIFGQPGQKVPVQFGTKYNVTGGIDASQVLFDRSILLGINASKESESLAQLNQQKTEEQLMYDIASAYYNAQITFTQKKIIESNLEKISGLVNITKTQFDNGFAKKTDYDRLVVNQTNLQTDLQNLNLNYDQQLIVLKYYMGMPLDSAIQTETGITAVTVNALPTSLNQVDLKILHTQKNLYQLNLQQINSGYIPSLSMSFRYAYQAQQNSLDLFSTSTQWFPNSYLAFNLNIPIFDGLSKRAKSQQVKIQMKQTELDEKNLKENIQMQNMTAQNKWQTNRAAVQTQENNMKLAEEVYQTTQTQYQGGIISLSDLLNAENALQEAQTNYLKAIIQVKVAELDLLKSSGNIQSIIQ